MFQKMVVVGYVGGDPVMRYTPNGTPVTGFSVAANEKWTDKETNEPVVRTVWMKVSAWGKLAEAVNQHVNKGDLVLVEGQLRDPSAYLRQDGTPAASIELTARTVKFLSPKNGKGSGPTDADIPPELSKSDEEEFPF